jgi:putative endopeptidase
MTVGENTADIAGIAVAYDAIMTKQGQDTIKNWRLYTRPTFLSSVARIWKVKEEEFLRQQPIHHLFGVLMDH